MKTLREMKLGKQAPTLRRTKITIAGIPIGTIVLAIGAAAMLSSLLLVFFQVNMVGLVTLEGRAKPLFNFDGQDFETPYLNVSADLTDLTAGETKTFSHHIENMDAGSWLVTFNLSAEQYFYNDPYSEFYGLNVSVANIKLNGVPTTVPALAPGDTLSWDFVWSLHHEFVTAPDPLPSLIQINLTKTNMAPTVSNYNLYIGYSQTKTINVVQNDTDPDGDTITVVSFQAPPQLVVSIVNGGTCLQVHDNLQDNWVYDVLVTVSDGHNHNVVEHLYVHCAM